jgi:hypothetical protein
VADLTGTSGWFGLEHVADFDRNGWLIWTGIRTNLPGRAPGLLALVQEHANDVLHPFEARC